ncbi:hypothetical protein PAAG_04482 [Paracoccidioides lutzii Pb01]|uniref:Uncharacterized protein n=1 Tax=Paracoccidioides lutzii (strain ATCC MYA-826 / Pb01) TaxID=502779 RepID=C1H138_PARBA|nr:hypothetical protein PAAG_04482 [Paracoccidioides lutzii Pb01]EEH33432.1 hypothetical protein PAAG_04482 [Paracoccidioides lutzii Pb01]
MSSEGDTDCELLWDDETKPLVSIDQALKDDKLKRDKTWGFVVYRCSYKDEDAWKNMLDLIRCHMEDYLTAAGGGDLWAQHELIAIDNKAQFDGASSHVVRDHFNHWVQEEMAKLPKLPESEREEEDVLRKNIISETRYNFCLFIDDICLESVEHMTEPVVKLLCRGWGPLPVNKRAYTVHPNFEDGNTANENEDVGWRYIEVLSCFQFYDKLHEPRRWRVHYARPPYWPYQNVHGVPGFWRKMEEEDTARTTE